MPTESVEKLRESRLKSTNFTEWHGAIPGNGKSIRYIDIESTFIIRIVLLYFISMIKYTTFHVHTTLISLL